MTRTATVLVLTAALTLSGAARQDAAPLAVSAHTSPPPAALAKPIAAALQNGGVRVVVKGSVPIELWWVSAIPAKGTAQATWADVEEGTLVGAASIGADFRDIRGRVIKSGVYTLRYGIQPANGDHLGVSPFREFLLLSPAAADSDPAPRGHDGTIEISKLAVGGSHPGVWSIDPPAAKAPALQLHKTELDHDGVIVEVPVTRSGTPSGTLRFGIVLVGKIEA
jgi:hypothetical protein